MTADGVQPRRLKLQRVLPARASDRRRVQLGTYTLNSIQYQDPTGILLYLVGDHAPERARGPHSY
eukprot:SAG31_NODE_43814_length_265_cov_0.933735_1_plen_64_part_01